MAKAPESPLSKYLSSASWRTGRPCQTCRHAQVEEINSALREFADGVASGKTAIPFAVVARDFFAARYPGLGTADSLKRHATLCLGLKVVR